MAKKYTITKEDAEEIKRCALDYDHHCGPELLEELVHA